MDVMRAEAEVSKRDQDLTVARTSPATSGTAHQKCVNQES
jgi:hypothetical protein